MLMGVSPMAPAWYVLALSLIGLGLGLWLRQDLVATRARRWRNPRAKCAFEKSAIGRWR
jgi:hypothetical protein